MGSQRDTAAGTLGSVVVNALSGLARLVPLYDLKRARSLEHLFLLAHTNVDVGLKKAA